MGELADATGLSVSTVRRRISDLRAEGVLYFDAELPPRRPAIPEVSFAAAVNGAANLYASIQVDSAESLYRYLTEAVAALPGLRHTVTTPIHRTLKGPGPYPPPLEP